MLENTVCGEQDINLNYRAKKVYLEDITSFPEVKGTDNPSNDSANC